MSTATGEGPSSSRRRDADAAALVVDLWQAEHVTAVHVALDTFSGDVNKKLVAAPTIAIFSDGNEDIAFGYLNAAGIPDSQGQTWPAKKNGDSVYPDHPDALNVAQVSGPTDTDHADGALFDDDGNPAYCQLMTMHWGVKDVVDEVVAEIRAYLEHPVHLFAECQAVNALENNMHGLFLTPNGFEIADQPDAVQFLNVTLAFGQLDGEFETIGGSEPAYSLPEGDEYHDQDIVMLTASDSPAGTQDVFMTGYLDGICSIYEDPDSAPSGSGCSEGAGKVSYLGGHKYEVKLPISENPKTQGTRLFLNSLFEADCATEAGQPYALLKKNGPALSTDGAVTWTITLTNYGPGAIQSVVVTDVIPSGAVFVDAQPEHVFDAETNTVTWTVGNVGAGSTVTLSLMVSLTEIGAVENTATAVYQVGVSDKMLVSNTFGTIYDVDTDGDGCPDTAEMEQGTSIDDKDSDDDGIEDCDDICPTVPNAMQDLESDP